MCRQDKTERCTRDEIGYSVSQMRRRGLDTEKKCGGEMVAVWKYKYILYILIDRNSRHTCAWVRQKTKLYPTIYFKLCSASLKITSGFVKIQTKIKWVIQPLLWNESEKCSTFSNFPAVYLWTGTYCINIWNSWAGFWYHLQHVSRLVSTCSTQVTAFWYSESVKLHVFVFLPPLLLRLATNLLLCSQSAATQTLTHTLGRS